MYLNTIFQQAVSIAASVAGCTAPPFGGAVVMAAELGLGDLLRDLFPDSGSQSDPIKPIVYAVTNAITEEFVKNDLKGYIDDITWAQNQLTTLTGESVPTPKSIQAALTHDPDGAFATLYNFLHTEVSGNGRLVPALTHLAVADDQGDINQVDGNAQATYVPTFAFGVSTYLMLATYWATLVTAVEPAAINDTSLYVVANYLTSTPTSGKVGWIDYYQSAVNEYVKKVNDRLAEVNNSPADGVRVYSAPGYMFKEYDAILFSDNGGPVDNFHPNPQVLKFWADFDQQVNGRPPCEVVFPGDLGNITCCCPNAVFALNIGTDPVPPSGQDWIVDKCNTLRSQYITLMEQTLHANYFDPNLSQAMVADWQANLAKVQKALGR